MSVKKKYFCRDARFLNPFFLNFQLPGAKKRIKKTSISTNVSPFLYREGFSTQDFKVHIHWNYSITFNSKTVHEIRVENYGAWLTPIFSTVNYELMRNHVYLHAQNTSLAAVLVTAGSTIKLQYFKDPSPGALHWIPNVSSPKAWALLNSKSPSLPRRVESFS